MSQSGKPVKLYIDASPLAESRMTGIPHFTAELIKALDRHPENGKSFKLILVIAFDKKNRLGRWNHRNVRIVRVPLPMRILNLVWKYNLLPPLDIFLGRGVYLFPNYKNWPLLRSACLTFIHDLGYIRFPQFVQPKNLKFLQDNMQRWISRSDQILTGSDHTRQEIITLLDVLPKKINRIYHGVEHEAYYPRSEAEIKNAKSAYGIKGEYILYLGSLEPRKNLVRLITSYRNLPAELRSRYALCLIGGGGWLNDDVLAEIKAAREQGYNIIQPKKYVEDGDLPALISGSTLLVHPALYEGFGLPPLQAMACGVPVAVGNNSSLPEVVGSAGVLFNAEDDKDISAKMEKVLSDEQYRARLVKSGLDQAAKFDWSRSASQLINIIEDLNSSNG